jgi:hypothetical protein
VRSLIARGSAIAETSQAGLEDLRDALLECEKGGFNESSESPLETKFLALLALGDAEKAHGRRPEAVTLFERAQEAADLWNQRESSMSAIRALSVAHTRLGMLLAQEADLVRARAHFLKAVELRNNAIARFGISRQRLADLESAQAKLQNLDRLGQDSFLLPNQPSAGPISGTITVIVGDAKK